MSIIQANGLSKSFGDFKAVDNVSFTVERGEVTGFLGPNGAGKSTTMKMLCGFLSPDAGTASISGIDILADPVQAKRKLGYLPEGAPAYADMSVAGYLDFVGRMRGLRGRRLRSRLAEVVDRINLADVWNRQIDNLSKGFKRRVGIAQSLVHDPEVLVLDEPTDGLDPNQKHEMRELIRTIAPDKGIIISTHILEEVEAVCSHTIIIAQGKVVADATPEKLIDEHASGPAVQLVLAGRSKDLTIDSLKPLPGVESVEVLEQSDAATRLLLHTGVTGPDPAAVFAALRNTGAPVREYVQYRPTLEDVFRQITRDQARDSYVTAPSA